MNIQAELRLYSGTDGSILAIFDQWVSLRETKLLDKVGDLTLVLDGNDPKTALFTIDCLLELRRTDLDIALAWYTEFIGLVRDTSDAFDGSGLRQFTVKAYDLKHLLTRRTIIPAAGSELDSYNTAADTIQYQLVNKNAGPGAADSTRRLTGLSVTAAAGTASVLAQDFRYHTQLLAALSTLSDAAWRAGVGADFDVLWSGPSTTPANNLLFTFTTYVPQLGTDRTVGNAGANPPTIFSQTFDNIEMPVYTDARVNEATMAYVLGAGSGASRQIFQVLLTAAAASLWNRNELVVDAQNVTTQAMANAVANAELFKRRRAQSLSFSPIQTQATRYGRDWKLGDLVTAYYAGKTFNARVQGVTITFDKNFEKIKGVVQSYAVT